MCIKYEVFKAAVAVRYSVRSEEDVEPMKGSIGAKEPIPPYIPPNGGKP